MVKKRSLAAALAGVEPKAQVALEQAREPEGNTAKPKPVGILIYVSAEDHQRIRDLSYHSKTSLQQLGIEAWSRLLESRGLDPLTKTTATASGGKKSD